MGPSAVRPEDRTISGLRVQSELPLPQLPASPGNADDAVDLIIELGAVPALASPIVAHRFLQIDASGTCRYEVPDVAAYRVSPDGRRVTIEQLGACNPIETRTFLLGTVIAMVFLRRGLLPLHACCVQVGDRAIAFAGESGAGKSTLAAGLVQRGFSILADDVTVVDLSSGAAIARPAFPGVKLWQESLDRIQISNESLERVRPELDKYHLPIAQFCATPLPLAALVHLESRSSAPAGIRMLGKMAAISLIPTLLYRPQLMARMGLMDWRLRESLKLVGAVGGVYALRRLETPQDWDNLIAAMHALAE